MDGLEASRRIKQTDTGKSTIVVALTAHALEEERKDILAAGCDDFVRKPFREQNIFEVMAKYLGVKYVYEKLQEAVPPSAQDAAAPAAQVDAGQLADLPHALQSELEGALQHIDREAVQDTIAKIASHNPALADTLAAEARDLQFGRLLRMVRAASNSNHIETK
jgi:CheY-like chemotaxis protein